MKPSSLPAILTIEAPPRLDPEWAAFVMGTKVGDVLKFGLARDRWRVTDVSALSVSLRPVKITP